MILALPYVLLQVTRNPLDPLRNTLYYLRQHDVIHEETPEEVSDSLVTCDEA